MISDNESVDINEEAIQALLEFSEGDMRKSITFLQVLMKHSLYFTGICVYIIFISKFLCVYICIYVCIYVCICIYVCSSLYIFMSICVYQAYHFQV